MMLKKTIRNGAARICDFSGILSRAERAATSELTVLCYHRILPESQKRAYAFPDLAVTPAAFDSQCRVLASRYEVRTLGEAYALLRSGYRGERPLAAITFDDGYLDNYRYALPALRSSGLTATFFVVSGLAGKNACPWYDRLARDSRYLASQGRLRDLVSSLGIALSPGPGNGLAPRDIVRRAKELGSADRKRIVEAFSEAAATDLANPETDFIMGADELRALIAEGHEIGAHSVSHEILTGLSGQSLEAEVSGAKSALEALTGNAVRGFCYPNGNYDGQTLGAVKGAGYEYACTTVPGNNPRSTPALELRRRFICEDRLAGLFGKPSSALFRMELTGLADRAFGRNQK